VIANGDWENIRKEEVMANCKIFQQFVGATEGSAKDFSQCS
jgi:hypothetical protein